MFSTVVVWVKLMMAQSIVLGKVLCYTLYVLQGPSWQSRFFKLTMMDERQISFVTTTRFCVLAQPIKSELLVNL